METISLHVKSVDHLLDESAAPLVGPRIHPEVMAALLAAAKKLNGQVNRIEFIVPLADQPHAAEVQAAVTGCFRTLAEDADCELRENRRDSGFNLLIGMVAVTALFLVASLLPRFIDGYFLTVLSESLVIIGWVTLWIPAEGLLFAPFPIRRKRKLARTLAAAPVKLVSS